MKKWLKYQKMLVVKSPEAEAPAPAESSPDVMADQQAAPQQESVWNAFKQIDEFKDQGDRAIAERLFQAYQQEQKATQALAQYQQIMPAAQEYCLIVLSIRTGWRHETIRNHHPQAPVQQAPPQKESWWNPPTISDRHARYIIKDEEWQRHY